MIQLLLQSFSIESTEILIDLHDRKHNKPLISQKNERFAVGIFGIIGSNLTCENVVHFNYLWIYLVDNSNSNTLARIGQRQNGLKAQNR